VATVVLEDRARGRDEEENLKTSKADKKKIKGKTLRKGDHTTDQGEGH